MTGDYESDPLRHFAYRSGRHDNVLKPSILCAIARALKLPHQHLP